MVRPAGRTDQVVQTGQFRGEEGRFPAASDDDRAMLGHRCDHRMMIVPTGQPAVLESDPVGPVEWPAAPEDRRVQARRPGGAERDPGRTGDIELGLKEAQ